MEQLQMSIELKKILNTEYGDEYPYKSVFKIEMELQDQFKLSLKSTLTDVLKMVSPIENDVEPTGTNNYFNLCKKEFEQRVANAGDGYQTLISTIKNIEDEYKQNIITNVVDNIHIIPKPVKMWDIKTVGFYCNQQDPNIKISDLLYFLFTNSFEDVMLGPSVKIKQSITALAKGIADSLFHRDLKKERDSNFFQKPDSQNRDSNNPFPDNENSNQKNKLKWLGTPSQFGFFISLLTEKGFIKLNASSEKNAELLLSVFDMDSAQGITSKQSLGKVFQKLKKDECPINPDDSAKFYKFFPHRNELKK